MTTVNLTSTLTITSNNNAKIIKRMKKLGVYQKILNKQLNEQKGHLLVDKDFFMWEEGDYWHYRATTQEEILDAFDRLHEMVTATRH